MLPADTTRSLPGYFRDIGGLQLLVRGRPRPHSGLIGARTTSSAFRAYWCADDLVRIPGLGPRCGVEGDADGGVRAPQ